MLHIVHKMPHKVYTMPHKVRTVPHKVCTVPQKVPTMPYSYLARVNFTTMPGARTDSACSERTTDRWWSITYHVFTSSPTRLSSARSTGTGSFSVPPSSAAPVPWYVHCPPSFSTFPLLLAFFQRLLPPGIWISVVVNLVKWWFHQFSRFFYTKYSMQLYWK